MTEFDTPPTRQLTEEELVQRIHAGLGRDTYGDTKALNACNEALKNKMDEFMRRIGIEPDSRFPKKR